MMAEPMADARLILPDPASAPAAINNGTAGTGKPICSISTPRKQQDITVLNQKFDGFVQDRSPKSYIAVV